ncbi:hypothetical protein BL124_00001240 [Klebsiella pneumoniae]|uniref:Uncharacterized protein n=1 Tax=Klebsiella pneumoniae TaxID=573 RepID=A0A423A1F9_KLEPN|nr:hypothetical protein C4Y93_021910 [Klebsiella pneumoniae subsp. pneumoniae]ROH04884.1 hypothetical protein BL124_00001240 [Klebsiella pneumoniae]HBX6319853.1 hypothetical protein [Klebsiella pneumoniae]HBX6320218.1 hypothetical protein [Klebsiella pneumoniae]HBY0031482.1 hypothetical protein [Klebsiella pneumoniae]
MLVSCIDTFKPLEKLIMAKAPLGTTGTTGGTCPESGIWTIVGTPSTTAPIAKNNRFPPYAGKSVTWKLTQYA